MGVANVLSTTTAAPTFLAAITSLFISTTLSVGLVGPLPAYAQYVGPCSPPVGKPCWCRQEIESPYHWRYCVTAPPTGYARAEVTVIGDAPDLPKIVIPVVISGAEVASGAAGR